MKEFIRLYPLSKTLRFELKPIGKTLENIERNGILNEDEKRAEDYKIAKKIIDDYHKYFIDKSLRDFKLKLKGDNKKDSLEEFDNYYKIKQKTDGEKKDFQTIQENLRKQITKRFTEFNEYKDLFKKELIKNNLLDFVKTEEEKKIIESFKDFTSYFNGFNINRSNMYSNEDKSTAIAFRLINQNLPKFIDNIAIFNKLKDTTIKESLNILYKDFEAYLNVNSIDEIFNLDYYTEILTQTQIDLYNSIIGGRTIEGDKKIKGLNEYINEYNQQHNKNERLPKFQSLYKQILADRDSTSFILEEFENDNEMLECIEKCYNGIKDILGGEHSLKYLLENIKSYDLEHIYIRNDLQLTNISQYLFSSWSVISRAIRNDLEKTNSQTQKESNEKYEDRINKLIKSFDNFSIFYINQCLKKYNSNNDINIADYFSKHCLKNEKEETNDLFSIIEKNYNNVKDLLNTNYPKEKHLSQDENNVIKIKLFLDSIKGIQNFIKPLVYKGEEADKDNNFYSDFIELWNNLNDIINPLYNKVRNRMTSKPYSTEKIKINFSNVTLLDGWDVNKEKDNTSVILRKDGLYYLGIMDKKHNKIFEQEGISIQGPYYEKMEYKLDT
jgi:CRISPR-associated protein Cpf1